MRSSDSKKTAISGNNTKNKQVEYKKRRVTFGLQILPEIMDSVNAIYIQDNCRSKSEFIEKAVKFYIGYLSQNVNVNYISPMITETVKAQINGTEQRLARLLFKVAVELGKLTHLLAAANDVDDETLRQLHVMCINEVRKINGVIDCEDAVRYQKE